MKKTLSLLLAVALVLSLFASVGSVASAASAGQQLKDLGVIKGDTSGSLNETSTWDKQDLAVLVSRLVGEEEVAAATPAEYGFNDIEDDYYDGYITWALQKGYITGNSEREYGFNEPVTYKVLNAVLLRVLGYDTTGANYDTTEDLAVQVGLSEATDFDAPAVRGIAYGSILAALNTAIKGGTVTLGQKLGVLYGTAASIKISVPTGLVANGTDNGVVTATVYDKDGFKVKNFTGTVTFASSSTAAATLAATTAAAVNGVATVKVTATANAGASLISASALGVTGVTATVTTVAPKISKIVLSADAKTIAADGLSNTTIGSTFYDQSGVAFAGSTAGAITAYVSSNTNVLTVPTAANNVVYATSVPGVSAISVTTSDASVVVVPVSVSTAIVGAAYKLAIDPIADASVAAGATVVVRVLDINGNQLTGPSGNNAITLTKTNASGTVTPGSAQAATAGKKQFTAIANTTAETVTYTATATGLVSATATGKFIASTPATILLSASVDRLAANGLAQSKITATVKDASGNLVGNGYKVKFSTTTSQTAIAYFNDTTLDAGTGTVSINVTATTQIGSGVVSAYLLTPDGTTTIGSVQTVTINTEHQGVATKLVSSGASASATAGTATNVQFKVQDASSTVVTSETGRPVTLTVYNAAGVVVQTLSANSVNGIVTFPVTLNNVLQGPYKLVASSAGLTDSAPAWNGAGSVSVTVAAGTAVGLTVTTSHATIAADGISHTAVIVGAVDAYGNVATVPQGVTVTASSVQFGTLNGQGTLFTSTNTPGSTIITAFATGFTSGSATVNTVVTGNATNLVISALGGSVEGIYYQNVAVKIVDGNGNVRTNDTSVVTLNIVRGGGSPTVVTAAAVQGVAYFTTTATSTTAIALSATAATAPATSTASATALVFTAGVVTTGQSTTAATVTTLPNDGVTVSNLTFTLKDQFGNVATNATGNVTFAITAGTDYATLLNTSATVVNGVVSVALQSKAHTAGSAAPITVTATYGATTLTGTITSAN